MAERSSRWICVECSRGFPSWGECEHCQGEPLLDASLPSTREFLRTLDAQAARRMEFLLALAKIGVAVLMWLSVPAAVASLGLLVSAILPRPEAVVGRVLILLALVLLWVWPMLGLGRGVGSKLWERVLAWEQRVLRRRWRFEAVWRDD